MAVGQAKVPLAVVCGILGLAIGGAAGVLGMKAFGYHWSPEPKGEDGPGGGRPPGMPGGPEMGGRPGSGFPGGQGIPGMPPGFGQSAAKDQLVKLIVTLDRLTGKPVTLALTDDQKAKLLGQLKGLPAKGELSEEDARKKLEVLLKDLKDHLATLKDAGFSLEQAPRPPVPIPNPFAEEENKKHLEALEKKLAKAGA
jgi:hypothetical protein